MELLKCLAIFQLGVMVGIGFILFVQGSDGRNYTDDEEKY